MLDLKQGLLFLLIFVFIFVFSDIQVINPIDDSFKLTWKAHNHEIEMIQVAMDNTVVVTYSNIEIKVWIKDSDKYLEKFMIKVSEGGVNTIALSEKGDLLAYTEAKLKLQIWSITAGNYRLIKKIKLLEEVE